LLAQVGAHASGQFAERLARMNLTPPQAGILRIIERAGGLSQQSLCERLGMPPNRLVAVLDGLEGHGLIERRNNPADRRSNALHLTDAGREALVGIGQIARDHQDALCAALDQSERARLRDYLARIAAEQGLKAGVHPGYRTLGMGHRGRGERDRPRDGGPREGGGGREPGRETEPGATGACDASFNDM
jgi:DNA-binding MarR family transcriptional regulator